MKLVDLYLIVNFFYVFASLIEFALVSYEPPVQTIGKSWLQNTRERMRMMNAKPANGMSANRSEGESSGGDTNNNNPKLPTRRKLSGLVNRKLALKSPFSQDSQEPMTYCNTVLNQKVSNNTLYKLPYMTGS